MRLFIAIQLTQKVKASLKDVQDELRRRGVRGNFTPVDNLHLTLAFVGEYSSPEDVAEVMDSLAFPPICLRLDSLGSFGEVWWAGIEENDVLNVTVRQLRHKLADAGIPFDRKKFSPHITLLRKPVWNRDPKIGILVLPKTEMTVEHISLMRSTRGKNGMIYTEIAAVAAQR